MKKSSPNPTISATYRGQVHASKLVHIRQFTNIDEVNSMYLPYLYIHQKMLQVAVTLLVKVPCTSTSYRCDAANYSVLFLWAIGTVSYK